MPQKKQKNTEVVVNVQAPQQKKQKNRAYIKRKKQGPQETQGRHKAKFKALAALKMNDQRCKLAECIALPGSTNGFRLPTVDAPRTSVMVTRDQYTISNTNTAPLNWNNGDLLVAFFGQPGRLAMMYGTTTVGQYLLNFSAYNAATGTPTTSLDWTISPAAIAGNFEISQPWPLTSATTTGPGPHGKTMALGLSGADDNMFIWMNAGDTISTNGTSWTSTAVGNIVFQIVRWAGKSTPEFINSNTTITLVSGNVPNGSIVYSAGVPAYYQVIFAGFYFTSGGITSTNNSIRLALNCNATTGWSQRSMVDLDPGQGGDPTIGECIRVNACSLLMSNTTAEINKQGTVLAARLKADLFSAVTPDLLARAAEKYSGPAANGVYTFKEFAVENEAFKVSATVAPALFFDLNTDEFFHFIQISCPNAGTGGVNTYTVSIDTVVEFKSDSARYRKATSGFRADDLILARRHINSVPNWFYENPNHMADLYNFIRRGAAGAYRAAKFVAPAANHMAAAASMVHPGGAAAYELLAQLLRRL